MKQSHCVVIFLLFLSFASTPFVFCCLTQDMRNRELNNGRFAMVAITGIVVAELVTGKDAVQQLGL